MKALTRAQHELLEFIKGFQAQAGYSPNFDEMRAALGLASKSGVHRMIAALEERGFIRRLPNRARAIEVVPDPHLNPTPAEALSLDELTREVRRRGYIVGFLHHDTAFGGQVFSERRC